MISFRGGLVRIFALWRKLRLGGDRAPPPAFDGGGGGPAYPIDAEEAALTREWRMAKMKHELAIFKKLGDCSVEATAGPAAIIGESMRAASPDAGAVYSVGPAAIIGESMRAASPGAAPAAAPPGPAGIYGKRGPYKKKVGQLIVRDVST